MNMPFDVQMIAMVLALHPKVEDIKESVKDVADAVESENSGRSGKS